MTSEDFVDEFNEQGTDYSHAVADNHGYIKILDRMGDLLCDYNGDVWEFRGTGYDVLRLSTKLLELMAEYAKGDVEEHIGLDWED